MRFTFGGTLSAPAKIDERRSCVVWGGLGVVRESSDVEEEELRIFWRLSVDCSNSIPRFKKCKNVLQG